MRPSLNRDRTGQKSEENRSHADEAAHNPPTTAVPTTPTTNETLELLPPNADRAVMMAEHTTVGAAMHHLHQPVFGPNETMIGITTDVQMRGIMTVTLKIGGETIVSGAGVQARDLAV